MCVETYLKDVKLKKMIGKLSKSSWIAKGSAKRAKICISETGTSGGELIAAKNDIDSYPVHVNVLEQIQNETGEVTSFAARISASVVLNA